MKKNRTISRWIFPLIFIFVLLAVEFWAQEEVVCPQDTRLFSESFNNTTWMDPISSVDNWGAGFVTLNKLGSNFDVANPEYIPVWINTVSTDDFDNDGWPDFVASSSDYSNVLAFVRNMGADDPELIGTFDITHWIDGSDGDAADNPTAGVGGAPIDDNGHCGLVSGDWDDDGDIDFMFIAAPGGDGPYTPKRIWLYENELEDTGNLGFNQVDKTSEWSDELKGIAWSATMMVSIDFDGDGDIDILVGNSEGEVILIRNRSIKKPLDDKNKWQIEQVLDTGWAERGVSTLSVADFDTDGDLDIIVGSVSYPELRYYKNDGSGNFSLYTTYGSAYFDGAASVAICEDFDADGDPDIMIGTDNFNYRAYEIGGQCYYFKNAGGDFSVAWNFDRRPEVYDFDLGASFDFDQDGDQDFLIADGNHSENYYLFVNNLADVYNLEGTAQSINISPELDPELHSITKVQFIRLIQDVVGGSSEGLAIDYYVSNNDGRNWEFYTRFADIQIGTASDMPVHTFKHYGTKLKWKAILTAEDDEIPAYPNSSWETPLIDQLDLEYTFVERREYSRTSVATSVLTDEGNIKLIIGGTFYFPGWQGHLRAYDMTNLAPLNSSYTELRTISRSDLTDPSGREIVPEEGVSILWDAGALLNDRTSASRTIYTALPNPPVGGSLERRDFTVANAVDLGPILADVNGDNAGLIDFVRGEGRYWKLGDINHSNPLILGPPDGIPGLMGAGYDTFLDDNSDRPKTLFVGTNDGMIHCFDVLTGVELWAFIPYNLLPKLKNMWAVDQATAERYFLRDVYVDGSPAVADVNIAGEWKTILVCGQGPGKGSVIGGGQTGNYYFALDVTDPTNPQPLWEFTHDAMGETWSIPVVGKVHYEGGDAWICFMGSGYDNSLDLDLGNVFYAVNLEDGSLIWEFEALDVDTSPSFPNIPNALPGSPSIVDRDNEGYFDSVYICDLDGRVWKVDISEDSVFPWTAEAIYTDTENYPIVTKPTVFIDPTVAMAPPRLFFGTGGDDRAPSDVIYSFVALLDNGGEEDPLGEVEWFMGDSSDNRPEEKAVGTLDIGNKIWADPVIADFIVYFTSLSGSIESVDPCENLEGAGKLYGRFVVSRAGSVVGGSAFGSAGGRLESLDLAIKTRAAVTVGEQERTSSGVRKREVYMQEYDSTIQKLEHTTGGLLKIRSWREIYKIIKK